MTEEEIRVGKEAWTAFLIGIGGYIRENHYRFQPNSEIDDLLESVSGTLQQTCDELPLGSEHIDQINHLRRVLFASIRREKIQWHLAPFCRETLNLHLLVIFISSFQTDYVKHKQQTRR